MSNSKSKPAITPDTQEIKKTGQLPAQNLGNSFPAPLSPDQEAHFINLYTDGNPNEKKLAKNTLIEHNLRLVAHIVKKFHHPDTEDLISIGSIGLIKGINSFKPEKGTRLATYASRCIENAMVFWVTHITPFLSLRKIYVCFRAFQEDVYDVALYDYAL